MHTPLPACLHVVTKRAEKDEMYNKFRVLKLYIRQCDKNAAKSAFGRLISLFKYSAEEEARICDGGGWGEKGGLQSGSGCDMEYSDGGGRIQLTPFHAFFAAPCMKHMGRG